MSEHIYVSTNIISSIYFIYEISLISPNFITVLPGGSDGEAFAYNAGDLGLIPGSGKSPGEGNGNLLQYSCLENPHYQRNLEGYSPWGCKELDMTERLTLEKSTAPRSNTLAWKIPWTEGPGRLQSMVSLRVRHDWATSLSLFTFMHLRRQWQPTTMLLPGESQGQGSLVGCRLWGRTESDTTEAT